MTEADKPEEAPAANEPAATPAAQPQTATAEPPPASAADSVQVQSVELPELEEHDVAAGTGQIDILLESAMPVSVRVGELEVQIKQLLQMGPGSILTLTKQLGDPVDLYLRGIRFATGYLVVVGNQVGVRIKEILANPK